MPLECRRDFWRQNTRVSGLSYIVVIVILGLAVFVQLRLVSDGRANGQTHDGIIYHARIGRARKARQFYNFVTNAA